MQSLYKSNRNLIAGHLQRSIWAFWSCHANRAICSQIRCVAGQKSSEYSEDCRRKFCRFANCREGWLRPSEIPCLLRGRLARNHRTHRGGLWIVRAADRAEVEALIQTDPFWTQGLRERVEIHSWHRAFDEPVTL
uniref:YciI family protein n=1 Tax=Cupriavidus taiwanensis TaxID=164546 RepID=UPI0027957B14|nr:YciI family protein [Cupriavidus taiwanensis]